MTTDNADVVRYLKRKKWAYNDRNPEQFIVKTCPFCGDRKNHFYINRKTGQYICWKCNETGNLYEMKKKLGDVHAISRISDATVKGMSKKKLLTLGQKVRGWHNALRANKTARRRILDEWGWKSRAIEDFKLGVQLHGGKYWLVYPQIQNKKLVNIKFRTLPPQKKKFRRTTGGGSILYNIDNLDRTVEYVILVEGESDTITTHTYLKQKNVLGVTVGARGFKPEWKDILDEFQKIYLVYDNDPVGQDGAEKLAKRLGLKKCHNVLIPQNEESNKRMDITDWWKSGGTVKQFEQLLQSAEPFDMQEIITLSQVLEELEVEMFLNNRVESQGLHTPWESVNQIVGSFIPGDLIVVSAPAKTGKTTFCLNIMTNYALQGIPILMYELEMRPQRTVNKIVTYFRGITKDQIQHEDITVSKTLLGPKPFYMAHPRQFTVEQVFDTIREAVPYYGIEALCFDHLHFLIRSTQHVTEQVSVTVRDFKLLAEELGIPVLLICQPRKLSGNKRRVTIDDLKDSSSIGQDADTVIVLYRERIPDSQHNSSGPLFSNETEVIVEATRWNPGGKCKIHFNGGMSRYFLNKAEERKFLSKE